MEMKKSVRFAEDFKKPMRADMLCTIDGEMMHLFMKNT